MLYNLLADNFCTHHNYKLTADSIQESAAVILGLPLLLVRQSLVRKWRSFAMIKITEKETSRFRTYLQTQERSKSTIQKYIHDVAVLAQYTQGALKNKRQLINFKEYLLARGYAASSVNSMLAAINQFLLFENHPEWKLRFLKIQYTTFSYKERELTRAEYERMVRAAEEQKDERLSILLQTICATGIRVSEIKGITVEAVKQGRGQIFSKGKVRQILIPKELCKTLRSYCERKNIKTGYIFITRSGHLMDRSNIWKMMKRLARDAKVKLQKAFPHNLRHLFACSYYEKYKDIVRLADILGHSCVDTTRIYTRRHGEEQQKQIEGLCLMLSPKLLDTAKTT